jgi:hypothetical protein
MNNITPEPCELAEIIYNLPPSGDFEEQLFGSNIGSFLSIKFSDKDCINEWIGRLAFRSQGDEREQGFWFDLDQMKILRWERPWWKFW